MTTARPPHRVRAGAPAPIPFPAEPWRATEPRVKQALSEEEAWAQQLAAIRRHPGHVRRLQRVSTAPSRRLIAARVLLAVAALAGLVAMVLPWLQG